MAGVVLCWDWRLVCGYREWWGNLSGNSLWADGLPKDLVAIVALWSSKGPLPELRDGIP